MGIKRVELTTYTSDRCGFESEDRVCRGGYANVGIRYSFRSYNGDTGGSSVDAFLCGNCAVRLINFMDGE